MKQLIFTILLFITVTLISFNSSGQSNQSKIDSLGRLYNNEQNDSIKASLLLQIGDLFDNYSRRDSALIYYKKALALSKKIKNPVLQDV